MSRGSTLVLLYNQTLSNDVSWNKKFPMHTELHQAIFDLLLSNVDSILLYQDPIQVLSMQVLPHKFNSILLLLLLIQPCSIKPRSNCKYSI